MMKYYNKEYPNESFDSKLHHALVILYVNAIHTTNLTPTNEKRIKKNMRYIVKWIRQYHGNIIPKV